MMQQREKVSHINNERSLKLGFSLEISQEFNLNEIESDPFRSACQHITERVSKPLGRAEERDGDGAQLSSCRYRPDLNKDGRHLPLHKNDAKLSRYER